MTKGKKKAAGPMTDLYRQFACQSDQLAAGIYTAADSQFGREMLSKLTSGDYLPIVSASIDPMDYSNADTFGRDYLCAELMSKFPEWDLGLDRAAVALSKFTDVELALSKLRLSGNPKIVHGKKSCTMRAVEMTARRKIDGILGDFSWDECFRSFAFGKGASTSLPRKRGDASYKFGAERPQLSYNMLTVADALYKAVPIWGFVPEVTTGSRVITVPKNAKTDRVIAVEPDLNMFCQKGIGGCIRRRLRRRGLLLPWAQTLNNELAKEGSANGQLATVDLSSASDSIHLDVVRALLRPEWVSAIETCRSPALVLPCGKTIYPYKVSSMGNGSTFELETLIFYGLCQAVIELLANEGDERRCLVYGDDIIIATGLVEPLREVLCFFGFTLNLKKTHWRSQFRESCGKHYFAGIDVTPFYLKKPVMTNQRLMWLANRIRERARLPVWGLDGRYRPVYEWVVGQIPRSLRFLRIPDGFGDGGLVVDWDEATPSKHPAGWQGWSFSFALPLTEVEQLGGRGSLLKSLHLLERGPVETDELPSELAHNVSWKISNEGYAPQWPSYGPWVDVSPDVPLGL